LRTALTHIAAQKNDIWLIQSGEIARVFADQVPPGDALT